MLYYHNGSRANITQHWRRRDAGCINIVIWKNKVIITVIINVINDDHAVGENRHGQNRHHEHFISGYVITDAAIVEQAIRLDRMEWPDEIRALMSLSHGN